MRLSHLYESAFLLAGCIITLSACESERVSEPNWSCRGAVYMRVKNASQDDLDSVEVAGINFGALKRGALSDYQPALDCSSVFGMSATSGARRFSSNPVDSTARPLEPGYYTQELSTVRRGSAWLVTSNRVSP